MWACTLLDQQWEAEVGEEDKEEEEEDSMRRKRGRARLAPI